MMKMLQLILLSIVAVEVELIVGHEREEPEMSAAAAASLDRQQHFIARYPQIYSLYQILGPTERSKELEFMVRPDRRSRLFVGKRVYNGDYETGGLGENAADEGAAEADEFFLRENDQFKRNHLFVGKRASPRFVGKRAAEDQLRMTRRKRFSDAGKERENGKHEVMTMNDGPLREHWMGLAESLSRENEGEVKRGHRFVGKRGHRFVGKRPGGDESSDSRLDLDEAKRSRLFVGRRSDEEFDDQRRDQSNYYEYFPEEDVTEDAKRSRLFVGKRYPTEEDVEEVDRKDAKEADTLPANRQHEQQQQQQPATAAVSSFNAAGKTAA